MVVEFRRRANFGFVNHVTITCALIAKIKTKSNVPSNINWNIKREGSNASSVKKKNGPLCIVQAKCVILIFVLPARLKVINRRKILVVIQLIKLRIVKIKELYVTFVANTLRE